MMVVIITGGGRGIGAAAAQLFATKGYDVLITSRNAQELEATCQHVRQEAPSKRVLSFVCDVSKEDQVKALFAYCQKMLGCPRVLVNSAGVIKTAPFIETSLADWEFVQAVNIRGTMLTCREAFWMMRHNGGGSIVNISSLGGVTNVEKVCGFAAYTTSKAAVIGLSQALALEGKQWGIRVNCLAPGAVNTRMLAEAAPGFTTKVEPMDMAKSIFTLADDELAGHISGSVLEVFSND